MGVAIVANHGSHTGSPSPAGVLLHESECKVSPMRTQMWIFLYVVIYTYVPKYKHGASLVAQWLRICLPMQGTQVQALVWEDPTCHGATGPVSHNY